MDRIGVRLLDQKATAPTKAHATDAGWDLYASEDALVTPDQIALVSTGVALDIPEGWVVQVCSRSGLAAKFGVCVLNAPGIVDAGYQGEVKVVIANFGYRRFEVKPGDRIAQLVPLRIPEVSLEVVSEAPAPTDRAAGGFGSSGR